jgi:sec-independent protein translocase protein TatB
MFDIGFTELLLIAVVALVVLGPEKLPVAIRTLGLWIGKAKRTISGIQTEISEELRIDELKRTASVAKEQLDKELEDMKTPFITDEEIQSSNSSTTQDLATVSEESEETAQPEPVPIDNDKKKTDE